MPNGLNHFHLLKGKIATWMRPITMSSMLDIKHAHPDAKLVVGNTEVGIEMKFKAMDYPYLVAATHVPELREISVDDQGVRFGASVTLARLMATCKELIAAR